MSWQFSFQYRFAEIVPPPGRKAQRPIPYKRQLKKMASTA
jgi:hypothetical protein